jgi:hypothetical protein
VRIERYSVLVLSERLLVGIRLGVGPRIVGGATGQRRDEGEEKRATENGGLA